MLLGNFNDTQNKKIVANLQDQLKLNPTTDAIPKQVIPTIQPVFNAEPNVTEAVASTAITASGAGTVFRSNATKDTYISYVGLCFIKDATCDVATGSLSLAVTIKGTGYSIARLPLITLTAQNQMFIVSLNKPIRIDRDTDVNILADAHTAGVFNKVAVVGYYLGDIGQEAIGV